MLQGGKTLQTSSEMLKSPEIRKFNDPLLHAFHIFLSTEQKLVGLLAFWKVLPINLLKNHIVEQNWVTNGYANIIFVYSLKPSLGQKCVFPLVQCS